MTAFHGQTLLNCLPENFTRRDGVLTDTDEILSGADLVGRARQLADDITSQAICRVALMADNGVPWIVADLACQQAGIALLPIPTFFTPAQIEHALTEVGVDLLLVGNSSENQLLHLHLDKGVWTGLPLQHQGLKIYRQKDPLNSSPAKLPNQTGKITYTSGSTGTPKGVCLSNAQLVQQARALAEAVAIPGSRHLCLLPLSVLLENVAGVYTAMINGGTVIAPSLSSLGLNGSSSVNTKKLLESISHYNPETLILIPQLLIAIVRACEMGWKAPESLRFIAVGGSKVSPGLVARARQYGLPVYEGYGLSECASVVSLNTPENDRSGSVGKPLPHLAVSFEDGEVVVSGNPFLGYVNDAQSWHHQHIRTGDLGQLDDKGFLSLQGRKKNLLINSFGRNISPEWVESELTAASLIQEAVVFGDSKPWLCALVLPRSAETTRREIFAWIAKVNANLPDYARIHNWLLLDKPLSEMPGLTTTTGKPRREAIYRAYERAIENLYMENNPETVSQ